METTKTIETYLPIFSGFYETIFEPEGEDDEIEDINYSREEKGLEPINYDNCKWNYEEYRTEVSKEVTSYIGKELKDLFKGITVTYQNLYSPKFYNFSNDSINIEVKATTKALAQIKVYLLENIEAFTEHTRERNTSQDGFIAFHSNDVSKWLSEYFYQIEEKAHFLGAMLDFILANEGIDDATIYENIETTSVSATNYHELIGE